MPVQHENVVEIDGKYYEIEGNVYRFKASTFAPKTVIGGYDDESDPLVSTFTFRQFGGIGQFAIVTPEDGARSSQSNAYIRLPGNLMLPPRQTIRSDSSIGNDDALWAEFANEVWTADSGQVRKFTGSGVFWGESKLDPAGATISDFKGGELNDSAILILANSSGSIEYSNTPDDSTSWASDSGHNVFKFAFWRDMLWGITDSGELAFTPDITSGWTQTARLRNDTAEIVELFTAPAFTGFGLDESLYAATKRGLFIYDNQNERFKATELQLPSNDVAVTTWNGAIYFSSGQRVFRFTPGPVNTVENVGPDYVQERGIIPDQKVGNIAAMTSGPTGVYAATKNSFAVLEYDGISWTQLNTQASSVVSGTTRDILFSGAYDRFRVYYGQSNVAGEAGTFSNDIPLLNQDILNDTTIEFGGLGGAEYRFPWFDGFAGGDEKLAVSLTAYVIVPDTNERITFRYRLIDDTGTFIEIGNTLDEGITGAKSVKFPINDTSGSIGVQFDRIQLQVSLRNASDSTHIKHTPILTRLSLNYIKGQSLRWGFKFRIKAAADGRTDREMQDDIEALFASQRLVKFTYRPDKGEAHTYTVKPFTPEMSEQTGFADETDYVLTLVEAV